MRSNCSCAFAAAIMVLLAAGRPLAAQPQSADPAADTAVASSPQPQASYQDWDPLEEFAARVGAWGVNTSGSPTKVGEYQGLRSFTAFWDFDGLFSDGDRTLDFSLTGPEDEATSARARYYGGPGLSAKIDYERFIHRLEQKTYPGWVDDPSNAPTDNFYSRNDFNPGQDYAIRVQEFKANFKGNLTDNIKWRLNTFGIYKQGERQANAMAHCYNASAPSPDPRIGTSTIRTRQCHAISQSQHIDWATTEVEPVIEVALADGLRFEYSHTIRVFDQNDQKVFNYYRNEPYGLPGGLDPDSGYTNGFPDPEFPGDATQVTNARAGYAIVPDSTTQIDRFKFYAELGTDTDLYTYAFFGDTRNELRKTRRHFGGADLRVTNNSVDGLTVTGYGKVYSENTTEPTQSLNSLYPDQHEFYREPTPPDDPAQYEDDHIVSYLDLINPAVDRDTDAFGANFRWRPFINECGARSRLAFTGGYEYARLRRHNVTYDFIGNPNSNPTTTAFTFVQPDSNSNTFTVGAEEKWSQRWTSYIRYKYINTAYPLYGESPEIINLLDDGLNSALPTKQNRVEIGGTWSPSENFMANATFYVENALNHGPYVNFDSTSYPYILSVWYAPTCKLSLTGGYANFTNWIDQDVTLTETRVATVPYTTTFPWKYAGKSDVFNIGAAYAWTDRLTLSGGYEYVHGLNDIYDSTVVPTAPTASYELGSYSRVSVNSSRVSAGIDYQLRQRVTTFFRYNLYDYSQPTQTINSGLAHMFLGGMTATF